MTPRYSITFATVLMLVLLRINIGWHFFSEGVKHYTDPHWTSEGFLRSATGPLAPLYHSYLPDFHHLDEMLHASSGENESHAVQGWIDEVQKDWADYQQKFGEHYGLNDAQLKQAGRLLKDYQESFRAWAADNKEALVTHVHEWQRKEQTRGAPAGDLPFQKKRLAERQASLAAEARAWVTQLKQDEAKFQADLVDLLDDDQRTLPMLRSGSNSLAVVDGVMTYLILAIGLLLIVGLFTRLACLAGAAFLLSVVMTQPFWISEAQPTFNNFVEMFALLALATTEVGRWAGLDYFLPRLSGNSKGQFDVPQS